MNPIDRILSVIAPHSCALCGLEGTSLCFECADTIDAHLSVCYACGRATKNWVPCTDCVHRYYPSHVWTYAAYADEVRQIITRYKFEQHRDLAPILACFIDGMLPYFAEPPLVSYVPTASSHRRERGFDHAQLLAKELCKLRGWRYEPLLRRISQKRQLGANRQERKRQLADAFMLHDSNNIQGQHVLLIDDVVTTGATLQACSRLLRKEGAKQVDAATFARTPW